MEELKMHCPLCGKAAYMEDRETFEHLVAEHGSACLYIECVDRTGCGLTMYCHHDTTDYDVMRQKAIERWERRSYG
jgi:hypothetical protein